MEVKGETSENVALFWRLFKEALAEVKGEPGYQFNPCGWITDEAGATSMGLVWYMVSRLCRKVILADSITHNVSITCFKKSLQIWVN